uniref:Uncharacterized protein n=1 Tax=viral metagenome TaxID=1070528 RepID=A0A6M3IIH2_9ZZZZ
MTELENPMNYKNNNHTESGQIDCKVSVMACGHCKDCINRELLEEIEGCPDNYLCNFLGINIPNHGDFYCGGFESKPSR